MKLTRIKKEQRDELGNQLREATTVSRFTRTKVIGGKKCFLLTYTTGSEAVNKAKEKGNYIEENFPI